MSQFDEDFFKNIVDHMTDGVYIVNRKREIQYWSGGAERLTGFSAQDVMGRNCRENLLNHVDDDGHNMCRERCPLHDTIKDGKPHEVRVHMAHASGHRQPVWVRASPLFDEDGKVIGVVETFSDDSAMRQKQEKVDSLEPLAFTDPLTGLGNRRKMDETLEIALERWRSATVPFGVLMIDLDHFKRVNDKHGHDVGDEVLRTVARTIQFALPGATLARYGGEEFVAILPGVDEAGLVEAGNKVRMLVASSKVPVGRRSLHVTVSVGGVNVSPGDDAQSVVHRADTALYEAKENGRNLVVVHGSHVEDQLLPMAPAIEAVTSDGELPPAT